MLNQALRPPGHQTLGSGKPVTSPSPSARGIMMQRAVACDGCVLRHVKCDGRQPCQECRKRGWDCTARRTRMKRGPKGPRKPTLDRIRNLQRHLATGCSDTVPTIGVERPPNIADRNANGQLIASRKLADEAPRESTSHLQQPISAHNTILVIFQEQLYPIWPVVSVDQLRYNLASDDSDFESRSLAAAVCAATIAQLRLDEQPSFPNRISALQFVQEAQQYRQQYDDGETYTVSSLLTAFFLHVYYANASKIKTATVLLREAITYVHGLELDRSGTYAALEPSLRALWLRIYWLLFMSEMTFCTGNGLLVILQPIDMLPPVEGALGNTDMQAFNALIHLSSWLHKHAMSRFCGTRLSSTASDAFRITPFRKNDIYASNEIQAVDLCTTRQWLRVLEWEYLCRTSVLSSRPKNPSLSLFLPVQIGHELLLALTKMDTSSLRSHGYGLQLKVFGIAEAVVDVETCTALSTRSDAMVMGSRDILSALVKVLETVGGFEPQFAAAVRRRIAGLSQTGMFWQHRTILSSAYETADANVGHEKAG